MSTNLTIPAHAIPEFQIVIADHGDAISAGIAAHVPGKCLQPGCGKVLGPKNSSGWCAKHRRPGDRAAQRFCKDCAGRLRVDTPLDMEYCPKCRGAKLRLCKECGGRLPAVTPLDLDTCITCRRAKLPGSRSGRLTVATRVGNDRNGHARWLCHCDCGNKPIVLEAHLLSGKTKSCGCLKHQPAKNFIEIVPETVFGHATVVARAPNRDKRAWWLCRCDCGKEFEASGKSLLHGRTKSCGCYRAQLVSEARKTAEEQMTEPQRQARANAIKAVRSTPESREKSRKYHARNKEKLAEADRVAAELVAAIAERSKLSDALQKQDAIIQTLKDRQVGRTPTRRNDAKKYGPRLSELRSRNVAWRQVCITMKREIGESRSQGGWRHVLEEFERMMLEKPL